MDYSSAMKCLSISINPYIARASHVKHVLTTTTEVVSSYPTAEETKSTRLCSYTETMPGDTGRGSLPTWSNA